MTGLDAPPSFVTAHGIPIANLWHMLLYAWGQARTTLPWRSAVEAAPSLDALFASILGNALEQRLRVGLGRDYVSERQCLRGVRGRVDFGESLKRLSFENGMAVCRFQDFSFNVPKNRIVASTLSLLAQVGRFGPEAERAEALRRRLRRLCRDLHGLDPIDVTPALIRRQVLGRDEQDYRLMLAICELVVLRRMPTHASGIGTHPGLDTDELILHNLYEKFVANFYRMHLCDWHVQVQPRIKWHSEIPSRFLPTMQPDVILDHRQTGRRIVLDTKFTAHSLVQSGYGGYSFDSSHLYQMYAYLRSQEHLSERHRNAEGILLYPTARWELDEAVKLQGHLLRLHTVDLSQPWTTIEKRLLEMIENEQGSANHDMQQIHGVKG